MSLIATAATFVLDTLLQSEEVKKFPKDFINASAKWVRSWFLEDDPKTEEKLTSEKSRDYKQAVVESKLEELLANPTFEQELKTKLAEWEKHAASVNMQNTIQGSNINVGGDFDNYQAGGNITITHNYSTPPASATPPPVQVTKPIVTPETKEKLQGYVANNQTKEAIDKLLSLSNGHPEFMKMVLAQSNKWEQLKHQEMMGSISFSDASVEQSKIVTAVLNLIGGL